MGNGSVNTLCSNGSDDCELGGASSVRPRDLLLPLAACTCLVRNGFFLFFLNFVHFSLFFFQIASYVACGALLLSEAQGWSAGEALYFCFIALCTVGFGGLRPEDPHLLPCVLYLFFGLAVLSTCFHLAREELRAASARRRRAAAAAARQQRSGSLMSSLESLGNKGRTAVT